MNVITKTDREAGVQLAGRDVALRGIPAQPVHNVVELALIPEAGCVGQGVALRDILVQPVLIDVV